MKNFLFVIVMVLMMLCVLVSSNIAFAEQPVYTDRRINIITGFMDRVKKRENWTNNDKIDGEVMDTFYGIEIDSNLFTKKYGGNNKFLDYFLRGLRMKAAYEHIQTDSNKYYTGTKSNISISLNHRIFNSVIKIEPGIVYRYETTKTKLNREIFADRVDIFIPVFQKMELGVRLDNKIFSSSSPSTLLFLFSFAFAS